MRYYLMLMATLAVSACVTTGEPSVTQADRNLIYEAFDETTACKIKLASRTPTPEADRQTIARTCDCVRTEFSRQMAPWLVKVLADASRGIKPTGDERELNTRIKAETDRLDPVAYRACGVIP